jgi:hypothetical protein
LENQQSAITSELMAGSSPNFYYSSAGNVNIVFKQMCVTTMPGQPCNKLHIHFEHALWGHRNETVIA